MQYKRRNSERYGYGEQYFFKLTALAVMVLVSFGVVVNNMNAVLNAVANLLQLGYNVGFVGIEVQLFGGKVKADVFIAFCLRYPRSGRSSGFQVCMCIS